MCSRTGTSIGWNRVRGGGAWQREDPKIWTSNGWIKVKKGCGTNKNLDVYWLDQREGEWQTPRIGMFIGWIKVRSGCGRERERETPRTGCPLVIGPE